MESRYEKKDKQKNKIIHFLFICGNNQSRGVLFIYLFIHLIFKKKLINFGVGISFHFCSKILLGQFFPPKV